MNALFSQLNLIEPAAFEAQRYSRALLHLLDLAQENPYRHYSSEDMSCVLALLDALAQDMAQAESESADVTPLAIIKQQQNIIAEAMQDAELASERLADSAERFTIRQALADIDQAMTHQMVAVERLAVHHE